MDKELNIHVIFWRTIMLLISLGEDKIQFTWHLRVWLQKKPVVLITDVKVLMAERFLFLLPEVLIGNFHVYLKSLKASLLQVKG